MRRLLSQPRLVLLLAACGVAVLAIVSAQPSMADPLWEDIAAIEQAQQQQAQLPPMPLEEEPTAAGPIRVPLQRRSPRDVINSMLSRPTP